MKVNTILYGRLAGRFNELQLIEFYRNISRATNHSFNTNIIYRYGFRFR